MVQATSEPGDDHKEAIAVEVLAARAARAARRLLAIADKPDGPGAAAERHWQAEFSRWFWPLYPQALETAEEWLLEHGESADQAEELADECAAKLRTVIHQYDPRKCHGQRPFQAWFKHVVENHRTDRWRAWRRQQQAAQTSICNGPQSKAQNAGCSRATELRCLFEGYPTIHTWDRIHVRGRTPKQARDECDVLDLLIDGQSPEVIGEVLKLSAFQVCRYGETAIYHLLLVRAVEDRWQAQTSLETFLAWHRRQSSPTSERDLAWFIQAVIEQDPANTGAAGAVLANALRRVDASFRHYLADPASGPDGVAIARRCGLLRRRPTPFVLLPDHRGGDR